MIEIANIIKQQLQVYKEEVKDYQENAEIMEMIFSLGMADDVYLSTASSSDKNYEETISKEIIKFLDKFIDDYDGWIPLDELYCRFNRSRGTGIIPPQKLVQICAKRLQKDSDDAYLYIPNFQVSESESIKMICKSELSAENIIDWIVQHVEEDEEEGMRPKEIAERMGMKIGILEPFLNAGLRQGRLCVDWQDLMGEKYYPNSILSW